MSDMVPVGPDPFGIVDVLIRCRRIEKFDNVVNAPIIHPVFQKSM